MYQNQMSATEIYSLWHHDPGHEFFFTNSPPARKYYVELRGAMYQELTELGHCDLIEQYLSANRMDVILYYAMCDVLSTVSKNRTLAKVHGDYLSGPYKKIPWNYLSQNYLETDVHPSDKAEMKRLYQKIKDACQDRSGQGRQSPGNEPFDVTGWSTAPRHPGADPTETARKCAAMVEDAKKQRDSILQQADAQRVGIENETNIKRSEILESANREAERIIAEANTEAARIREEALRRAEDAAREDAEILVQRQLGNYMRRQRSQWEEDRQALDNARADMSAAIPTLKEDICNITTSAGAQINSGLDAMLEQLNTMKTDLLFNMNRWRSDLYKCEYGNLVNFYLSFSAVAAQFERDVCLEQTKPMTQEQELTILQRHSSRMNNLRNTLVRAMEAMGLQTFTPQSGDVFDSYSHAANDMEDADLCNGRIIESCIAPGIQRVVNSQTVDVLHRATVQLRSEDENEG